MVVGDVNHNIGFDQKSTILYLLVMQNQTNYKPCIVIYHHVFISKNIAVFQYKKQVGNCQCDSID